ncbi:hypothetical protein V8C34DRAFT_82558 [Trichoderma compactum]
MGTDMMMEVSTIICCQALGLCEKLPDTRHLHTCPHEVAGGGMSWCCPSSFPILRSKIMSVASAVTLGMTSTITVTGLCLPISPTRHTRLTAVSMSNTIHPRFGFEAFRVCPRGLESLMVMDASHWTCPERSSTARRHLASGGLWMLAGMGARVRCIIPYHAGATNRILIGSSFPGSITIPVVPREDLQIPLGAIAGFC